MEPNPYEAPKMEQSLRPAQLVKRSIGLAVILLLTPPAFFFAVYTSCAVTIADVPILPPLFILFPPAALLGMLWAAAHLREKRKVDTAQSRFMNTLYATPIAMLLMSAVGFGCAVFAYYLVVTSAEFVRLFGENWPMVFAFWIPPGMALVVMLFRAWRYR